MDYETAKTMYETTRKRKLQNNTYLVKTDNGYGIKLHNTIVVEYLPDRTILNSGGWKTPTTKNRINEYMSTGIWSLIQNNGVWLISTGGFGVAATNYVFADGCYYKDKKWYNIGNDIKTINKQRKAVRKYAKDFTQALFDGKVPKPSTGDCWYCSMVVSKPDKDTGKPLGTAMKDKSHIESHIAEKYYVPSLLVNAQNEFGASQASWWVVGDLWNEPQCKGMANIYGRIVKQQIEQNIRRYCYRQLGLVS